MPRSNAPNLAIPCSALNGSAVRKLNLGSRAGLRAETVLVGHVRVRHVASESTLLARRSAEDTLSVAFTANFRLRVLLVQRLKLRNA